MINFYSHYYRAEFMDIGVHAGATVEVEGVNIYFTAELVCKTIH